MGRRTLLAIAVWLSGCHAAPPPPAGTAVAKKPDNPVTIRVGSTFPTPENCGVIRSVRPVYPPAARKAHIEGVVNFDVRISKSGEVSEIHLVSGNPIFVPAARKAVEQWRYAVCRLNSDPVEVRTRISLSFTLSQ